MNKQQFLKELQECLEGEVSRQAVYDNITYYDQYFEEQKAMGKSESQIAEEIGKPSLIAKTIVDAEDAYPLLHDHPAPRRPCRDACVRFGQCEMENQRTSDGRRSGDRGGGVLRFALHHRGCLVAVCHDPRLGTARHGADGAGGAFAAAGVLGMDQRICELRDSVVLVLTTYTNYITLNYLL